ncbi:hypothetical protein Tco_0913845 [Tanacetum coccineum]
MDPCNSAVGTIAYISPERINMDINQRKEDGCAVSMDCVHRIVIEHFQKYGKFSAESASSGGAPIDVFHIIKDHQVPVKKVAIEEVNTLLSYGASFFPRLLRQPGSPKAPPRPTVEGKKHIDISYCWSDIVNASLLGYIVVAIVTVVTMVIMRDFVVYGSLLGPKVADSLWLTNLDGSLFNIRYIDRVVMLISKSITDEMGSALIVACQRISSTIWRSGLTSSVPRGRWVYASGCDSNSSTAADVD